MKELKFFPLLLIAQLIIILIIPNLTYGLQDMIWLLAISLVYCIVFMFGTTRIIAAFNSSPSMFNARYFGTMGMRMLMGIILIVIYLKFSGTFNKAGTIFLICSYFVYMGFEIKIILTKLRTNSEKPKNADDAQK